MKTSQVKWVHFKRYRHKMICVWVANIMCTWHAHPHFRAYTLPSLFLQTCFFSSYSGPSWSFSLLDKLSVVLNEHPRPQRLLQVCSWGSQCFHRKQHQPHFRPLAAITHQTWSRCQHGEANRKTVLNQQLWVQTRDKVSIGMKPTVSFTAA